MKARSFLSDQRGVALPMAMLAVLILSGLVLALSGLSASEPTIANNHAMAAQARALAEAGVEHALWALMHPSEPNGIPAVGPIPAPYDGSRLVKVVRGGDDLGGFRVTVTAGQAGCASQAERCIVAVGWVPDERTAGPTAHHRIAVTVGNPRRIFKELPAALSSRGDLQASGGSVVDSRSDSTCGAKVGVIAAGQTSLSGSAGIYGGTDGNDTPNETVPADGGSTLPVADVVTDVPASTFDRLGWNDDEINFLRAFAKARGTYLRGGTSFGSGNKIANGLVFVDTASGKNVASDGATPTTPDSDLARVDIGGADAAADPSGVFRGWLFVNGGLSIIGDFQMEGLAYAQNELSYRGSSSKIAGAVVTRNVRRAAPTRIDSEPLGTTRIMYDCSLAKTGANFIPDVWIVMPGTYREPCDSCTS